MKVGDFGLAKVLEGVRGTITGGVTPVYAGPETFNGDVSWSTTGHKIGFVGQRRGQFAPQVLSLQKPSTPDTVASSDIDWDETFATLRDVAFSGIAAICVFGWEEDADAIHRRMLNKVTSALVGSAAGHGDVG